MPNASRITLVYSSSVISEIRAGASDASLRHVATVPPAAVPPPEPPTLLLPALPDWAGPLLSTTPVQAMPPRAPAASTQAARLFTTHRKPPKDARSREHVCVQQSWYTHR